jgi:hypothetical protein
MNKNLLAVILSIGLSRFALADAPKISPDLQNVAPNANVRVIVQYAQAPTAPTAENNGLLGGVLNLTSHLLTGVVNTVFNVLHAVVCTVPASSLSALAKDPMSFTSRRTARSLANWIIRPKLLMQALPGGPS